jgi:hypothetical protein
MRVVNSRSNVAGVLSAVGMLSVGLLTSCAVEDAEHDPPPSDVESKQSETDVVIPGEDPGSPDDKALNCVYVQWCNAPGWRGSVCRIRSSCVNQDYEHTLWFECINDVLSVCGNTSADHLLYPWEPL